LQVWINLRGHLIDVDDGNCALWISKETRMRAIDSVRIIFAAPAFIRLAALTMFIAISACIAGGAIWMLWWVLPPGLWRSGSVPIWYHFSAALGVATILLVVLNGLSAEAPVRLILCSDHIWLGSYWLGKRRAYSMVQSIKLITPKTKSASRNLLQVELNLTRNRNTRISLHAEEAKQCFHALRDLCESVIAVGLQGELYEPRKKAAAGQARKCLSETHRRKALWSLLAGAILGMIGVGCLIAVFILPQGASLMPGVKAGAIGLCLGAAGAIRHNILARRFLAERFSAESTPNLCQDSV
jgi:hypothetical protein